jgi:hypothetical protein
MSPLWAEWEVVMPYLFGFMCVLALGVMPMVGCNDSEGAGGSGGDGGTGGGVEPCHFPLSDLCEPSDCPTWDQAIAKAEAQAREGCVSFGRSIYSGACGDIRYVANYGLYGSTEYFDAVGALVAAERYDDVPSFCDETSFNIWYGPIPDCEQDRDHILENLCKEAGFEYCASVAECGAIGESECLARYNNLQCSWRWNTYVDCFRVGAACESCAEEHLADWEACNEESLATSGSR